MTLNTFCSLFVTFIENTIKFLRGIKELVLKCLFDSGVVKDYREEGV